MRLLFVALLAGSLCSLSGQSEGLLPRWEVIDLGKNLRENVDQIEKVLEQVQPAEWADKGASQAYAVQYENLQADLSSLGLSAEALARRPERLSVVVDTFLWLDRVSSMVGSMSAGVRRYQNGAMADLLDSAKGKADAGTATLKEYMRQLAVEQEAAMEIADSEAQRCREQLARQPSR